MAKRKLSLGEGGIKGLLANHVEKLLFGIILAVAGMLIWSGFNNREGIAATKTPVKLKEEVTRATSHITGFTWNEHYKESRSPKGANDLSARAAETLQKMDEDLYAHNQLIDPPVSTPRTKRTDPEVLAVTDLRAKTGYGALVKRAPRMTRDAGEASEEDVFGTEEPDRPGRQDLDPDIFRPIPNGYSIGGSGRGRGASEDSRGVYFVSVTGLIPYREQLKLYQTSFLNGSAFNPARDAPNYVFWRLERAEVQEGSDERDWKQIANSSSATKKEDALGIGRQGGMMGDRDTAIDPRAEDPILTRPVPPLVSRNLDRLAKHEKILSLEEAVEQMRQEKETETGEPADAANDGEDGEIEAIEIDPSMVNRTSRTGPGRGGFENDEGPMRPPMGLDDEGGMRPGMPGMPGQGMANLSGGAIDPSKTPEYKMFRYVDLNVEPGQSYVYRLRLYLEDPNFPLDEASEPPESSLEGNVIQRRKKKKALVASGRPRTNIAFRAADYSPESNPVTINAGTRMLAGPVKPARKIAPRGEGMAFVRTGEEPLAKAMALEFDLERAADIPGQLDVRRGTVANFQVDETEVLRSDLNSLEKVEDHKFRLNAMVLDIRGGDEHRQFDELNEPGKLLVLDARGRLSVLNELSDQEDFEGNIFPEESDKNNNRQRGYGGENELRGPPNFGGEE